MTLAFFTSLFLTLTLAYNFPVCSQRFLQVCLVSSADPMNYSVDLRFECWRRYLSLSFSNRTSLIALHSVKELWSHLVMYAELLKLSQELSAREFYYSFLTTSQYLNRGIEIVESSCSFPVHHSLLNFLVPSSISRLFHQPFLPTIVFRYFSFQFQPFFPFIFVLCHRLCIFHYKFQFLCISCYLSARELVRSQPTASEYLYRDPLTV